MYNAAPPIQPAPHQQYTTEEEGHNERKRRSWTLPIIIVVLVIALAVGLGAGLGVGLHKKSSSSSSATTHALASDYTIGGALNPAYYTTSGAFNGSGIALASQSFDGGDEGALVM